VTEAIISEPPAAAATRCLICGDEGSTVVFTGLVDYLTGESFGINRCQSCGLMVTLPLPAASDIGRFYPPKYRGDRHGFTGDLRTLLRRRAIESCFPKNFRGRLLDVGCGDGAFARHMHARGWTVAATEIDQVTIARLRETGIDARQSAEADRDGFSEPFDAITCWHVLEHVAQPLDTAEWIRSQLKSDGFFQATVPNAGCLQARLLGRHWIHLDVPRHRHHFTPATLRSLLELARLKPERQANFAIEYDWFGVIQSTLNLLCRQPNVLFDKLTNAPMSAAPSASDMLITLLASGPLAAASLPPIVVAAMLGDGGTLTLTCRR
jgi:SAM-dependent methyltransferase